MNPTSAFALASELTPVADAQEPASRGHALRVIAHQLRQPLSSIETIAFYLSMVVPHKDEKIQQQLRQIRMLVEQSNRILTEGMAGASHFDESPAVEAVAAAVTNCAAVPLGLTAA